MKLFYYLVSVFIVTSCITPKQQNIDQVIAQEIDAGNFTKVGSIIDSLITQGNLDATKQQAYLFTKDSLHRITLDFNKTREEIVSWIEENHQFRPTEEQFSTWEKNNILEYRIIDGEKRYFRNAAPNIFRVDQSVRDSLNLSVESDADETLNKHLPQLTATDTKGKYLLPRIPMHIKYTLTVEPDAVKDGELIKAWLPYPRKDIARQSDITFISASQNDYILSEDKTKHTSIYMEQRAKKNEPTVFTVEYSFSSQGEWFDLTKLSTLPYDTSSDIFRQYTAEKPPHIQFSDRIKTITDSITRGVDNPIEQLKVIYQYVTSNYPWASALEYSTIPNIPEYVIKNKKGDCGQVALLLITMLRYKGIPAHWQSGWMMHPGAVNLHDWTEVYFEGIGWIPVDPSFGRGAPLNNKTGRSFFTSGIDSYRLYVNSDFSDEFYPAKKYPRSETVDFQRGEVETETENLYFDKWNYNLEVVYK